MKKVLFLLFVSVFVLVGCSNNEEYRENLQSVTDQVLESAAEAEGILEEYTNIWRYSIENSSPMSVSDVSEEIGLDQDVIIEYFEINSAGNVPNDFSSNIHSLRSYYDPELEVIRKKSDEIRDRINEMNDPPKGYEDVYDEVLDMYIYAEEYIGMALNPSGSLQSFNEDKNRLSSEILNKYNRIEVLMPSED